LAVSAGKIKGAYRGKLYPENKKHNKFNTNPTNSIE